MTVIKNSESKESKCHYNNKNTSILFCFIQLNLNWPKLTKLSCYDGQQSDSIVIVIPYKAVTQGCFLPLIYESGP